MTTYATNNPIGSMHPKDLFDNAQNMDFALNDITKLIWKDRFGRNRKSFWGMEQEFLAQLLTQKAQLDAQILSQKQRFDIFIQNSGYEVIGEYTAGPLTINDYNQLIRYENELWRLSASTTPPFTTTGNNASSWVSDSAHLVSVGDAALRQQITDPDGAEKYPELQLARWRDEGDLRGWGAKADGKTDCAPALRSAIASNRKIIIRDGPRLSYLFNSSVSAIPGVASAPCVVIDGVQDLTIQGEGNPVIVMGPAMAATPGSSFILAYTSDVSAAAGKHTKRIKINGLTFKFMRSGVAGNIAGVNFTSVDESEISDCTFDARGVGPALGIPGTGSRKTKFLRNKFYGVSTCFDNSQLFDCTVADNVCDSYGESVVTAIGHFYDTNTLANIRLNPQPPAGLGSGNIYRNNTIVGYGSPISIRGMRDSLVIGNIIHGSVFNDDVIRNMISLYTENKEVLAGFNSGNITVTQNIIFNCKNTKNTTSAFRGIFINRSTGPYDNPLIVGNSISGMFGGSGPHIGISIDGITNGDIIANNSVLAATPYGRAVVTLLPGSQNGYSPTVSVSSGDLILKAEPGNYIRFGERSTSSDAPITGYLSVRDESGTVRKLALIG